MRPLIGIVASPLAPSGTRPAGIRQNATYPAAVATAGGLPVLIPILDDLPTLRALYERLDGILLPGGGDVNPACYGEAAETTAHLSGVDDRLDAVELALARWSLAEAKPILGICRGQQTLNVAAGGTLIQDIPSHLPTALPHQQPDARQELVHAIRVTPDSRLAGVLGANYLWANSIHHQAVARVAPGLVGVARAPDGVLEGLEHRDHPFALAVQFHPEELVPAHPPSVRLFATFVAACRS